MDDGMILLLWMTPSSTSPLRSSQRAGLSTNPLPPSINHLEGLSHLLWMSTKDGVIQTFWWCAHTRGQLSGRCVTIYKQASRVTNVNHPKEMLLVLLRWTWLHSQVKGSSSHLNLALTQSLAQIKSRISLKEGVGVEFVCLEVFFMNHEWSQQQMKKGLSLYNYLSPKIRRWCAGNVLVRTLNTWSEVPTSIKSAGREPLIGRSEKLPMGVVTSNPKCRKPNASEWIVSFTGC